MPTAPAEAKQTIACNFDHADSSSGEPFEANQWRDSDLSPVVNFLYILTRRACARRFLFEWIIPPSRFPGLLKPRISRMTFPMTSPKRRGWWQPT
jgi:hypothetical protein